MSRKDEAKQLVESLPEDFTWEDLMYEIHVRKAVEEGLADSEAGRTVPDEEVWAEYGLEP